MPDTTIVIADTSCLIVFQKIQCLSLLQKLYTDIYITPEIYNEFDESIPSWIQIHSAKGTLRQRELENNLDKGEASAIALAMEIEGCIIILDDLKARKVAEALKLNFTGSLGVLVKAKNEGHLNSIKPLLEQLKQNGMRFSQKVEEDILIQSKEI